MAKETRDYYEMSLAEIRDDKGLSRRELSQITGASEDTLYSIEKRKQVPKVSTAIAISRALGISLKQFCHSIGLDITGLPPDDIGPPGQSGSSTTPGADARSHKSTEH